MTTNYHGDSYSTTTYGNNYRYKKTYTVASLKKEIKAGFIEELRIGQKWHVIPMDWFDKWKLYVNYDNDLSEVRCPVTHLQFFYLLNLLLLLGK